MTWNPRPATCDLQIRPAVWVAELSLNRFICRKILCCLLFFRLNREGTGTLGRDLSRQIPYSMMSSHPPSHPALFYVLHLSLPHFSNMDACWTDFRRFSPPKFHDVIPCHVIPIKMTCTTLPKNNHGTNRIYSNKRRSWDKKVNKRRTADAPLIRGIPYNQEKHYKTFFHRVNFSRNSRFTISLVSVHRKVNR